MIVNHLTNAPRNFAQMLPRVVSRSPKMASARTRARRLVELLGPGCRLGPCGLCGGPPNIQPALVDARLVDEMLIIFDLARRLTLAPVMHGRKKRRAKAAARRLLPGQFVHHNAALARMDDYG